VKLSHRDFRPQRRLKYVAQPPKRRPTLRILLLAAIGLAVYLKYDTVVTSRTFQNLRNNSEALFQGLVNKGSDSLSANASDAGLRWSRDSASLEAICSSPKVDSCLEQWRGLGKETVGSLNAFLRKAFAQWDADAGGGFLARFRRVPNESDPLAPGNAGTLLEMDRLELRGAKGTVVLERNPEKNALCAEGRCLDELSPRAPFANFRQAAFPLRSDTQEARIPAAAFIPLGDAAAGPVLSGRVVGVSALAQADSIPAPTGTAIPDSAAETPGALASLRQWVKIYHGRNIFSYYRGFAELHGDLRPGKVVNTGDTLGLVPGKGDSLGVLELRIEQNGLMVDPYAFLGLRQDSAGPADVH
jgi:hypothetical protein